MTTNFVLLSNHRVFFQSTPPPKKKIILVNSVFNANKVSQSVKTIYSERFFSGSKSKVISGNWTPHFACMGVNKAAISQSEQFCRFCSLPVELLLFNLCGPANNCRGKLIVKIIIKRQRRRRKKKIFPPKILSR